MTILEKLRKDLNMNRRELSEKSGIPIRTIVSWERSERPLERVSYINVVKLAKALGVETNELFEEGSDARK